MRVGGRVGPLRLDRSFQYFHVERDVQLRIPVASAVNADDEAVQVHERRAGTAGLRAG